MMMIPEHRIPPLLISFKNYAKRKLLFSHTLAELTVNSLREARQHQESQFILKALEQWFSTSDAHLPSARELFTTLTPRLHPRPMKSDIWSWDFIKTSGLFQGAAKFENCSSRLRSPVLFTFL